jgi:lysozyme family protein
MAKSNFDICLREVLVHEGGYSNHPSDPGGRTNLGVTQATYEDWIGHPVSEQIMRKLTPALVTPLYKQKYWNVVRGDELPIGLDLCVFDFAVNAGPQRAARYLQRLVGAQTDGVLGPKTISLTLQYVSSLSHGYAAKKYQDMRLEYYHQLKTFNTFGRGWSRRVTEVEKAALNMILKAMKE